MKHLKRVLSLIMVAAMSLGMITTSVSAQTEEKIEKLEVSKTVSIAVKSTIPDQTFTFKMRPATDEEITATTENGSGKIDGITVEAGPDLLTDGEIDNTIAYDFGSSDDTSTPSENDDSICELTKSDKYFDLNKITFSNTGIYRYYIEEIAGSDDYITYDTHKFQVDLYVYDYDGAYGVGGIVLKRMDSKGVFDQNKPENVYFKNKVNVADVKISKKVVGESYTKNEKFKFYIRIPAGGDTIKLTEGQTIHAEIWDAKGFVANNDITVKRDLTEEEITVDYTDPDLAQVFYLEDGQYLKIPGAPVSMIYFVEEADVTEEGYTQKYKYTEEGRCSTVTIDNNTGTEDEDAIDAVTADGPVEIKGTVNTTTNKVEFINTRYIKTETGISVDIIPYVLVLLVAVCGGILFFIKKRRTNH